MRLSRSSAYNESREVMKKPLNIFISYSHSRSDAEFARRLGSELQKSRFNVFQDDDLLSGANWHAEVAKALDRSDAMIFLASPDFANSQSVQKELEYALTNSRFKDRVFCIEAKPTSANQIPWILRNRFLLEAKTPDAPAAN